MPDVILYTALAENDLPLETPISPSISVLEVDNEEQPKCASYTDYGCSCILGLVERGFTIKGNNAKDLQVNALVGNVGDIILFKYWNGEWIYHAGEILVKYPSGNMEIYECNFRPATCGKRTVLKSDSAIRGYLHKISN